MNKKYVLYQAKKWIVPFVILTAIMTLVFLFGVFNVDVGVYMCLSGNWKIGSTNCASDFLMYPAVILTIVPPFMVYSDRTSRTQTDTYRQTPFVSRSLRAHRLLIALAMYLISVIIAFLIGILCFGIQIATFETSETIRVQNYNFGYYFLELLVLLCECVLTYFVNCFFVSLGNNKTTQVIFLLCGCALLSMLPSILVDYCEECARNYEITTEYLSFTQFYSLTWMDFIFEPLICEFSSFDGIGDAYMNNYIVSTVFVHVIGAAAAFACFFIKDPSGENAGTPGCRNKAVQLIVPLTFLFLYMLDLQYGNTSPVMLSILLLLTVVLHYVVVMLVNKTPKLGKFDLIFNLSSMGLALVLGLIMLICRNVIEVEMPIESVNSIIGEVNALYR